MNLKNLLVIFLIIGFNLFSSKAYSFFHQSVPFDSIRVASKSQIDSLINDLQPKSPDMVNAYSNLSNDSISHFNSDCLFIEKVNAFKPVELDSLTLESNPFFTDLIYFDNPLSFQWDAQTELSKLINGHTENNFLYKYNQPFKTLDPYQIVSELRTDIRKRITLNAPHLYAYRLDKLPDLGVYENRFINSKPLTRVNLTKNEENYNTRKKIIVPKPELDPWTRKMNTMVQFSENYVSDNWYQGGSSNIAVLGILSGQLNYDNKKGIQWDNNAEWRAGFNSVQGDTLRFLNTNDDIFKVYSKLGIKAGGNWFYSGSVDFNTQFFNNYKAINSTVMKAALMTPVRLNVSIGLDYKYKKLFSFMFSPVSYKYIYARDIENVSPKLFGIPAGEHVLSQIGSSFKAQFAYSPAREFQLDSKLSFYTNYQKVEIDWEIVANFTVNRFLSTRLSLNPRYDNTVILAAEEKAEIQFKQLLSFGFSYKLLN